LPVFCHLPVLEGNLLLNQCLGSLTQGFSTGLPPKNVDILITDGDKSIDATLAHALAQGLHAPLAGNEKCLESMAWEACQALVHKLAPGKCG